MIELGDKETLAYLHHRHALWKQYRVALLFVRDQRPDIAPEGDATPGNSSSAEPA
jgi:hypothetical protein